MIRPREFMLRRSAPRCVSRPGALPAFDERAWRRPLRATRGGAPLRGGPGCAGGQPPIGGRRCSVAAPARSRRVSICDEAGRCEQPAHGLRLVVAVLEPAASRPARVLRGACDDRAQRLPGRRRRASALRAARGCSAARCGSPAGDVGRVAESDRSKRAPAQALPPRAARKLDRQRRAARRCSARPPARRAGIGRLHDRRCGVALCIASAIAPLPVPRSTTSRPASHRRAAPRRSSFDRPVDQQSRSPDAAPARPGATRAAGHGIPSRRRR